MAKIPISILAVDDEDALLEVLKRILVREGYYVHTAADGEEAIAILQTLPFDLVLLDIKMPKVDGVAVLKFVRSHLLDTQAIMLSALNEVDTAVECMRLGAYDYLRKPYDPTHLMGVVQRALERKRLVIENKALRTELQRIGISAHIITQDKAMLDAFETAARVAATDSPVLIQGETGTGKQMIADFLHKNSRRKDMPFMTVDCLRGRGLNLEAELFGDQANPLDVGKNVRQGIAEIANGGTVLLDEVQHISMPLQLKLLGFLNTGEFRSLGGAKTLRSDLRIISCTNADLQQRVREGSFGRELLEKLGAVTLTLPPLRERRQDIPLLADAILETVAAKRGRKRIDAKAMNLLMKYDWPGNVGELKNVLETTALICQEEIIKSNDLMLPVPKGEEPEPVDSGHTGARIGSPLSMKEMERRHIEGVLDSVFWDRREAAKILGLTQTKLVARIRGLRLKERG